MKRPNDHDFFTLEAGVGMMSGQGRSGSEQIGGRCGPVLALVLVTMIIGVPLLSGRVLSGHDIVVYLINAQQTAENVRVGELFPAWGGGFNAGFGAPTLLFFPPLTSYLHAIFVLLGLPVIVGVSVWSLVGLFLSGLAMYCWLSSAGMRTNALLASMVYMAAPYRIIDLYHRSALAEHWAFVWPPLILWVATSSRLRRTIRMPLLAFFVAGLLLSNIPLAILFGAGLAVWFVMSKHKGGGRPVIIFGAVLGFLIAAFALIPQALSSSLLSVDQYYGPNAGKFRPSVNTLFSGDVLTWDFNTQISIIVIATFLFVAISFFLLSPDQRVKTGARMAMAGSVICVVAMTKPAGLVWDVLPIISKTQFPWRVASLLTFGAAFMVAHLDRRRGWLIVLLVAVTSLGFSPWSRTLPRSAFLVPEPPSLPAGTVFPDPHVAWEAGGGGWYWRHENLAEIWFLARNTKPFYLSELAGNPAPQLDLIRHRPAVLLEDPSSVVRVVLWEPTRRVVEVDALVAGTLVWRAISFPDMGVTVDGRRVTVSADPTTGLVSHAVPPGEHEVRWSWRPFAALRWARAVSILGVLAAGALLLMAGASHRRLGRHPSGEA